MITSSRSRKTSSRTSFFFNSCSQVQNTTRGESRLARDTSQERRRFQSKVCRDKRKSDTYVPARELFKGTLTFKENRSRRRRDRTRDGCQIQPSDVLSHWSIDCIGPLPADPATGDTFVVMVIDWLSRWPEAVSSHSIGAATIEEFIYHRICCQFGVPESLRTDHGSGFDNEIMENLTKSLHVHHHRSTAYYPNLMV